MYGTEVNQVIISSKIKPPFINKLIIKRDALIQRFHKGLQGKLTIVVAPAGYGKSTMLAEGLEGITSQVAWVALDKHDNDEASRLSLIEGKGASKIDAKSKATRAEALLMILKVLNLNPDVKTLLDKLN
jgi:ATP/maltotriose-dependent transcriptional regulator MalT